jgi:hypothetical protein
VATRTEVTEWMVCDLHETEHEAEAGTIEFSYKGTDYSIDLCTAGDDRMDRALAPFIEAAQITQRGRKRNRASSNGQSNGQSPNDQIRSWARGNGYAVSDRGRIAGEVIAAYKDAHKRSRASASV